MKHIFLAVAIAAASLNVAQAADSTVALPTDLVNRVYNFLQNGGTYAEAQGLREALLFQAQAPNREADAQRKIDAAVAEALKKAAEKQQSDRSEPVPLSLTLPVDTQKTEPKAD